MSHTYDRYTLEQLERLLAESVVATQQRRVTVRSVHGGPACHAWLNAIEKAAPSLLARVRELEAAVREREAEILRLRTTETASAHALDRVRQACGLPERSAPFDVASFVENHLARKDTPCGD